MDKYLTNSTFKSTVAYIGTKIKILYFCKKLTFVAHVSISPAGKTSIFTSQNKHVALQTNVAIADLQDKVLKIKKGKAML